MPASDMSEGIVSSMYQAGVCSPVEQCAAAGDIISTPQLEYLVHLQQVGLHGATAETAGKTATKQWQHKWK